MGVQGLIGVLERTCGGAKREVTGAALRALKAQAGQNSVLAVDAMNLLFYLAGLEGGLGLQGELEGFCTFLRNHDLRAACVFDSNKMSKPRKLLAQDRREQRTAALSELNGLKNIKGVIPFSARRRHALLRSRTIHVDAEQVRAAQTQLSTSGVCTVFMATDEADSVCVDLVTNGTAFACLSNDSDMFVRDCRYVLRKYRPAEGTFELWDTKRVYKELSVEAEEFQAVCAAAVAARHTHNELYAALGRAGAGGSVAA